MGVGVQGHHRGRPGVPVPGRQHLDRSRHHIVGHLGVFLGEQPTQPGTPAQIGEPADGAARGGAVGDPAGQLDAQLGQPGGPLAASGDLHAGTHQPLAGIVGGSAVDGAVEPSPAAVVATSAPLLRPELWIVELTPQEGHPATVGGLVVEHRLLLAPAGLLQSPIPPFVVVPRRPGGHPATLHTTHGAVDVEHLEHHLQAGPIQIDQGLQRGCRRRTIRVERGDHRAHHGFRRERDRGKVPPPRRSTSTCPHVPPAGSTRSARTARRGGRRTRDRACRSPSPALT